MLVVIPLFPGLTALDAIGPYEVLCRVPGAEVTFAASAPGLQRAGNGTLALQADVDLADVTACDLVLVPGGPGVAAAAADEVLLTWLKAVDATTTCTASVCTGSLLLAHAGLLAGRSATTHWASMDLLAELGAVPQAERVVRDGKYVTAAGVSAGIDLALELAAEIAGVKVAQAIQLSIEYDPHPPYSAGSPRTAPADVVELVRSLVLRQRADRG